MNIQLNYFTTLINDDSNRQKPMAAKRSCRQMMTV
ncbi:hypothetical protein Mucpa_0231 [Mucilaginibacter paludis DSM 18603]|uniref:Uncharacterized protein n=1 Tax=Mucilaginibacter paludis DSM 18603 TaxID=714943 RepID=H1YFM8_9SPHI|nr:hypothetical protein Mucpa_0231 [Mucilaginibacter paludis DSM 18603]